MKNFSYTTFDNNSLRAPMHHVKSSIYDIRSLEKVVTRIDATVEQEEDSEMLSNSWIDININIYNKTHSFIIETHKKISDYFTGNSFLSLLRINIDQNKEERQDLLNNFI